MNNIHGHCKMNTKSPNSTSSTKIVVFCLDLLIIHFCSSNFMELIIVYSIYKTKVLKKY